MTRKRLCPKCQTELLPGRTYYCPNCQIEYTIIGLIDFEDLKEKMLSACSA